MTYKLKHKPIDIRRISPNSVPDIETHVVFEKVRIAATKEIIFGHDDGTYDFESLSSIYTNDYQTHEVILSVVKKCLIGPRPEGLPRYWPFFLNDYYLWNFLSVAAKEALQKQSKIIMDGELLSPIGVSNKIRIGGKAVFLFLFDNIDHLYRESLPTIIALKEVYGTLSGHVFIVPHCTENMLSILQLIGIKREQVVQVGNTWIECEEVVISSFLSFGHLHTPSNYYLKTCDELLSAIKITKFDELPKKIFVSRRNASQRRIENEIELYSDLIELGFFICDPGDYSMDEQIALFSSAEVIVGSHGMGIANCAFSKNLKLLVEIMPTTWNRVSYYRLAQLRDAKYACYWISPINGQLVINKLKFMSFIENIEGIKCY
ncbi:DUF563 domain-containing protein [Aeromonas veronii]